MLARELRSSLPQLGSVLASGTVEIHAPAAGELGAATLGKPFTLEGMASEADTRGEKLTMELELTRSR